MTTPRTPVPGPPPAGRFGPGPGAPRPDAPGSGVAVTDGPGPGVPGTGGPGPSAGVDGPTLVGTGHPAVDAVLRSLANSATLSPTDQIGEYEAAHRVLQETLAGIDRA